MKFRIHTLWLLFICSVLVSCHNEDINQDRQQYSYLHYVHYPLVTQEPTWTQEVTLKSPGVKWIGTDVRVHLPFYPDSVPELTGWHETTWKNERIHSQFVCWTKDSSELTITVEAPMDSKGNSIPKEAFQFFKVNFVMADEFGKGCENRLPRNFDSVLVGDMLEPLSTTQVTVNIVRPIWVSLDVPSETVPGKYIGKISITGSEVNSSFPVTIDVQDQTLALPSEWSFHLDLWQNPYAVARVYGVDPWSDQHFKILKPHLQLLADAGQKCITASVIHDPWNSQTYDVYQSMVQWVKHKEGNWSYDYRIFDRWVEACMDVGIKGQINCYSMVPWNLNFTYFDESLGTDVILNAIPGSPEYRQHWKSFLEDFSKHLTEKGWMDKAVIAMDERPMEAMLKVMSLLKEVAPQFKVALAGGYHGEIEEGVYDYCVASDQIIPEEAMNSRKAIQKPTTFYTCCVEKYPNTFTFSPPAEATFIGWHAYSKGYGGYLRWAYNSWVKDPAIDSRYKAWPSGDTYIVYPGPMSSIRFERLREGIQDYEKIKSLCTDPEMLSQLRPLLDNFEINNLQHTEASEILRKAKTELHRLSSRQGLVQ